MTYIFKVFVILSILFSVNGFTQQGAYCEVYNDGEGNIKIWVAVTPDLLGEGPCGGDINGNELWCRSDFGVYLKEECEKDLDACYDNKLIGTCRDKQFVLGEGIWVLLVPPFILLVLGLCFGYNYIQEERRKRREEKERKEKERKAESFISAGYGPQIVVYKYKNDIYKW